MTIAAVESILERLQGVRKNGAGWTARCPAHEDRHPSLSVSEGQDGRVLLKCFGGCTVEAICEGLGLRLADLMPNTLTDTDRTSRSPGKTEVVSMSMEQRNGQTYPTAEAAVEALERRHGRPSRSWTYQDSRGEPVGLVLRWDRPGGKDIRPVSGNGAGWAVGGMPQPRPLYGLPQLGDAKRVYVVEGELCVDAARSIELTATTSPHGSNSAGKADWSPLAGKEVIILPDADPAGRAYAKAVVGILRKLKPTPAVKIVTLPDLPEGGDICDFLEAHDAIEPEHLRRQIEELADAAEPAASGTSPPAMPAWKPFPVDALPEPVRGFVVAGSKAIGCDPTYVALPLLSALASAVGATRRIKLKSGWVEPCVIWAVTVGESGTLKSPGLSLAVDSLRRLQAWKLEEYPELLKQHEQNKALYDADYQAWKRTGRKNGEPPPEKPEEPVIQRYLVNDTTIEALADRLQHAPRGLLLATDEAASWLGSFDQYRSGRGGDVAKWLSVHRAESLLIDRKTGAVKTIFIKRAAVSVAGTITPRSLSRALGVEHLENGLAARLLLAHPPRRAKRWTEATVDRSLTKHIEKLFGRLLALDFTVDADDLPAPVDMPLAPDGKSSWISFYNDHAREQESAVGPLAAAFSKIEGYAARLALVVHLVRWASEDPSGADPDAIDAESVEAGANLAKWFCHEGRRIYAILGETEEDRDQRQLLELVQRKGGSVLPRDLMRASSRYATAEDAEAALAGLVNAGIGRWEYSGTAPTGGRPTSRFQLTDGVDTDTTPAKPDKNGVLSMSMGDNE